MYCENCGAKIDNDSKFCENCGVPVRQETEPEFARETEEMRPVTDINDLMGIESDFEKSWPDSEKTMVFVKPEGSARETQRIESVSRSGSAFEPEEVQRPEPEEAPEPDEKPNDEPEEAPKTEEAPEPAKLSDSEAEPEEEPERTEPEEMENLQQPDEAAEPEPSLPEEQAEPETPMGLDPEAEEILPIFGEPESGFSSRLQALLSRKREKEEAEQDPAPEEAPPIEAEPEADQELEPEEEEKPQINPASFAPEVTPPMFCMACGKKLPKGAAFCDACGTPTGEVAPVEIRRRGNKQSMILELMKGFFAKPASTIEKAASEDAFAAGVGFFIVKDVLLAILSAVFMKKLTASLGALSGLLLSGDPFGFGTKIFLCGIVLDGLWIALLYGAGRLFKQKCSVKELVGAAGTAALLPAVLLLITVILAAFAPDIAICAAVITGVTGLTFMTKAVAAVFKAGENGILYMTAAAAAGYAVILYIAARLII
ncbi:zinc-ribbon domain-containing protein [bacterium 210820-DFI.6.37]|nr:zinc-ribbon domain-containing protein [bacterium 210820-DFI.6.37]